MTTTLVEAYEDLLLETRARLLDDLHHLEEEEALPPIVSGGGILRWADGADVASEVQEQEADFLQVDRLSHRLTLLDDALELLRRDPGEFGTCRYCGDEIQEVRLEIVPWSRLCARCARGEAGVEERA